jgi:hypothetical protein
MLVAMVLAGLASAGLAFAARNLTAAQARLQRSAGLDRSLDRLNHDLGGGLRVAGPFTTDAAGDGALHGNERRFAFPCADRTCSAELDRERVAVARAEGGTRALPLRGIGATRWSYVSDLDGRPTAEWPPADRSDRLAAVVLMADASPLAVFRTVVQQPARCVFDARVHACREGRLP